MWKLSTRLLSRRKAVCTACALWVAWSWDTSQRVCDPAINKEQEAAKKYCAVCNTINTNISLWTLWAHQGRSVSKISALPRHRDHPIQDCASNWTAWEAEDGARGRDKGRMRWNLWSEHLSSFSLERKQSCRPGMCRDEKGSYKLAG